MNIARDLEGHYQTLKSLLKKWTIMSTQEVPQMDTAAPAITRKKEFERIELEYEAQLRVVEDMNSSLEHWSGKTKQRYGLEYDDLLPDAQDKVNNANKALVAGNFGQVRRVILGPYGNVSLLLAKKTIR